MLPAGSDFLREEESGHDRQRESKRIYSGTDLGLQGWHERNGHDRILYHLRRARGPDRTTRQADGRLLRGVKRDYHETRHDRRRLV